MRLFLILLCALGIKTAFSHDLSTHVAEGLFDIQIVCEDRSNPACNELNRRARLALIQTDEVLAASVGYPEVSIARYAFISKDLELKNGRYVGEQMVTSSSAAQFAEVSMEFIHQDQGGKHQLLVKGFIRDARFVKDVQFTGEQTLSLHTLKPNNSNINPFVDSSKTEGRFIAKGKDRQWIITIRKTLANPSGTAEYLAETTDMGSPDGTELASGERRYLRSIRSEQTDALEFVASLHSPGTFLKWVIWSSPERLISGGKFQGFFYSSSGVFSHLLIEAF